MQLTEKYPRRSREWPIDQACAGDSGDAGGREAMDGQILFRLLRVGLHGTALALGSFGVFCLYFSCMGAPVAMHAIVCLGSATAIVLASNREAGG
jgi:hypothetical protein